MLPALAPSTQAVSPSGSATSSNSPSSIHSASIQRLYSAAPTASAWPSSAVVYSCHDTPRTYRLRMWLPSVST